MLARYKAVLYGLFVLLLSMQAFGTTYYVSKSTGSDANTSTQAQSKTTPWAHLPKMCYASCGPTYTPVAGDQFIMMGCDVWTNGDLPATWQWSGTSGSPIYVGVDKTWYNHTNCPSAWNRPVWDAQKAGISGGGGNYFLDPSTDGTGPVQINDHDVIFDNIEMVHLEITSGLSGGFINWTFPNSVNMTYENLYLHAWDASADNCILIQGPYNGGTSSNIVYKNIVMDGSDRTGSSGTTGACYGFYTAYAGTKIINNVLRYIVNPWVGYGGTNPVEIGGNEIAFGLNSIAGANHCNLLEIVGGGTFYVHDNRMHDLLCSGGEGFMDGNNNETMYAWNNVIYDLYGAGGPTCGSSANCAQTPSSPQTGGQSNISLHYFNNTVVSPAGQACWNNSGQTGYSYTAFTLTNNHCIGASLSSTWASGTLPTLLTNFAQCDGAGVGCADYNTTPKFDQYTSSETFVYSSLASTNSTVGQGTNLTSSWPAGFSTSDTSYGATEQTIGGVVQAVVGRTSIGRPGSGAWDQGAYEFGAATQASQPSCSPGSGNYTSTQTVTCTNPNTGTTVMCYSTSTTPVTNGLGTSCTTGTKYTTTISVSSPETLNVVAGTSTLTDSTVASYVYTFNLSTPTFSPVGGSYSVSQNVVITGDSGTTICYTTDGSTPTATTPGTCLHGTSLASGGTVVVSVSETLEAMATKVGSTNSSVASATYTIGGIVYQTGCSVGHAATESTGNSYTFQCTPSNVNDAVVFMVHCHPSSGTISAISLAASGWTINQLVAPNTTGSNSWAALFGAIAPNTSLTTFTATFTGAADCGNFAMYLTGEFSGNNTSGGAATFPVSTGAGGASTGCNANATVTPTSNNNAVWFGCLDTVTLIGSPWIGGVNDGSNDYAEYQLLSGGSGVGQAAGYTGSGVYVVEGTAIAPSSVIPPQAGALGMMLP